MRILSVKSSNRNMVPFTGLYDQPREKKRRPLPKTTLTKKQRKRRAAAKAAGKARDKTHRISKRKRSREQPENCTPIKNLEPAKKSNYIPPEFSGLKWGVMYPPTDAQILKHGTW